MIQQINLYQLAVRPQKILLPVPHMALFAGLLCTVLAAYAFFLNYRVDDLNSDMRNLSSREAEIQEHLAGLQQSPSAKAPDPELLNRVESLQRAWDARIPLLEIFRDRKTTVSHDFSPVLESLARRSIKGVWLRRIVIGNSSRPMLALEGRALDPQLLPRYLKGLAEEESLSGFEFVSFSVMRPEERVGQVDFEMQTTERGE